MPMRILISNDDGIYSPGVECLANTLARCGHGITVVCPDRERSATGHALTLHKPLRVDRIGAPFDAEIEAWACSGTPSDCIKLGLDELLVDPPHWVVSGINRGPNLGTDVLYSGTVSAAMEGLLAGFPSMAVSLASFSATNFSPAARFVCDWMERQNQHPLPQPTLLNVNIPALPVEEICGVVVAPLGMRHYTESFEQRVDPRGRTYYWIAGEAIDTHAAPDSDIAALQDNYIAITPLQFNLTDFHLLPQMIGEGLAAYTPPTTATRSAHGR